MAGTTGSMVPINNKTTVGGMHAMLNERTTTTTHWSVRKTQPGRCLPSVDKLASLATKPELKMSAASLPCSSASSRSSSTWYTLVPEMLRVPPAPVPHSRVAFTIASTTTGFWPMPR